MRPIWWFMAGVVAGLMLVAPSSRSQNPTESEVLLTSINANTAAPVPPCGQVPCTTVIGNTNGMVNTNNVDTKLHVCGLQARAHLTTATDTNLVTLTAAQNIYVCDYEISFGNATTTLFLESSAANACTAPFQIAQAWGSTGSTAPKLAAQPYYRGINTGTTNALCVNSAGTTVLGDITVYYDKY
jgi:hypothetical protein